MLRPTPTVEVDQPSDPNSVPAPALFAAQTAAESLSSADVMTAPAVFADQTLVVPEISVFERLLRSAARKVGLDRAIAFTVLARGWGSLAGLLTVTLIARYLSPAEQGYYYVFYSLVALQMIFELGFSVVILQTASHECAHLHIAADGTITGSERAHGRLSSVLKKAARWYLCGAALLFCTLIPAGYRFFERQAAAHPSQTPVHWALPWTLVIVSTVFTFQVDPVFSFLEGCGFVAQVARSRFFQAVLGSLLGWGALLLHRGLFAPGMIVAGQALVGGYAIWGRRRLLLPLLTMKSGHEEVHWGSEIWPFQWRVAVSWVCGYFIYQLFTPVLFATPRWGPVEAGRMGMTISVAGALGAVSMAWMNTKASPFGRLIALKDYVALDRLFFRALVQSSTISLLGSAFLWCAVYLLLLRHVPIALRVLAPLPFALYLTAGVLNNVVFGFGLYLRAHKQEKFMFTSILGAVWGAAAAYFLGHPYGARGITAGYLAGTVVIGIGLGGYTFFKYRRLWHG